MIKIVAFDFDGVIMDSAYEIFLVCKKVLEKRGIEVDDSIVDKFKKSRNFLRTVHDLYGIVELFVQGKDLEKITQEEFDDFMKSHEKEIKEFCVEFWETRKEIQNQNYDKWFLLSKLFPGIRESIESLSKDFHIIIMSAKDFYSISTVLERYEIRIEKENIFSKDITDNKIDQIKRITEKFSVEPNEIFFIDDQPNQLKNLRNMDVNVALAGWGYNNNEQKEETRQQGIPVLMNPSDIEKEIKRLNQLEK